MKKIIITADDFGKDIKTNEAIWECAKFGILTDTCIMANGKAFEDAIEKSHSMDINIGIHLNIIEGKSLIANSKSILTDENGFYNLSYIEMLLLSYNKKFLKTVEEEFESQIKKALESGIKPTCLNSHVHVHSIPNIFKITCYLAKKYGIENIRTQREIPYFAGKINPINIIKNILLNIFTLLNNKTVKNHLLDTNNYFIGVLYTGQMTKDTFLKGIEKLPQNCNCEIILHPTKDENKCANYKEYLTLINSKLKSRIKRYN